MKGRVVKITAVAKPRPRVVYMTGTPVSESPENAYPLIRLIEPSLAISQSKFSSAFVEMEDGYFGPKVKGYRNLDRLREMLAHISIRRTMDEVEGMPPKVWMERTVYLGAAQMKAYNAIAKRTASEMVGSIGPDDLGSKTLRLRQVLCDPEIVGVEAPSAKFEAIEDIAAEVLADPMAKMVVWMSYITSMPKLLKQFAQYKPVALYGDTPDSEITRLQKTFDHSNERLVFASPAKAGTGTDFLNRARVAVYLDLPWSYTLFKQSQDRLVRRTNVASQDPIERLKGSPATLIKLRVPGSADDLVESILNRKVGLADNTDASVQKLSFTREELLSFIQELK